jgi:hypothetical protein
MRPRVHRVPLRPARAAWFAEFGTDCSGPQSGRIEPDLDPAPLGVYHRPVVGQDPESVHHAGGAKMIEPPLHLHGADAVSACISYSSGRGPPGAGAPGVMEHVRWVLGVMPLLIHD